MGLRSPEWLWLFALAAPLVLLYVLKVRRERVEVASTFLWQDALEELQARSPFRRLRKSGLLLLQLLLLALLALAAAGPIKRGLIPEGSRTAVVLDGSASMLADGRSDAARRELRRITGALERGASLALIEAGPEPRVLAPLTDEQTTLDEAIAGYRPSESPADIGAALELARALVGDEAALLLVTDSGSPAPLDKTIRLVRVGDAAANSGIVTLGTRQSDPSGGEHEVFVELFNASDRQAAGKLLIELDGDLRDARRVELAGGAGDSVLFTVQAREGTIEARWEPEGSDALTLDNRAHWVLRRPQTRSYRIRGGGDPFLEQALRSLPGWRAAAPDRTPDLEILFDGDPDPEGPPLLWIEPDRLERSIVEGPRILDWKATHPALRHVDLRPVRLGRVPRIERPDGARVIADSSAGPLMLEGVEGQRRYVAWGFHPSETDLPLRVSFPVLVQNTLEHLVPPGAGIEGGVAAGSSPEVPWADKQATLRSPSGQAYALVPRANRVRLPALDEVGVWSLEGSGAEPLRFAVGLRSRSESDLRGSSNAAGLFAGTAGGTPPGVEDPSSATGADPVGTAPAAAPRKAASTSGMRGFEKPVILLGLLLLLIEGLAYHRRWLR